MGTLENINSFRKKVGLTRGNLVNITEKFSAPEKYVEKYIADGRRLYEASSKPLEAVIEVGNKCNLNCLSCPTHSTTRSKDEMTPALFEDVIKKFKKMGLTYFKLHTNNEPIYNKNILELFKIINKEGVRVLLSTNGMLTADFIDNYLKAGLDLSRIDYRYSIDGAKPGTFEKLRRGGKHPQLISGLDHLQNVYKKHNLPCNLSVNYCVSTENIGEIPEFVKDYAKYFGNDHYYRNYCFRIIDARSAESKTNTLWGINNLYYPLYNKPCWIPNVSMTVQNDGKVPACCRDFNGTLIVGDVKEQLFEEIWMGKPLQSLRAAHAEQKIENYSLCQQCFWPSYLLQRGVDAYIRAIALHNYPDNSTEFAKSVANYIEANKNLTV